MHLEDQATYRQAREEAVDRLVSLVYALLVLSVLIEPEQMAYAAILAVLLGLRVWWALQRRLAPAPTGALRTAR